MSEEREETIEIITATQVANASLFNGVKKENPMLAKLMMDKLKSFLTKDCYSTMERQTVLMRFLQEHTDLDIIHDVLDYVNNSELKQDYTAIIMEWTYHNNDKIKKYYLAKCDGSLLCMAKEKQEPLFKEVKLEATHTFVQSILQILTQLAQDDNNDDGGEDLQA